MFRKLWSHGGVSGAQFLPTNIAGCVLWLRSDLGITKDESNRVSNWADQSIAGNNFIQPSQSLKPILTSGQLDGYLSLYFDGVNDYIACDNSSLAHMMSGDEKPFTFFWVQRTLYKTAGQTLWMFCDGSLVVNLNLMSANQGELTAHRDVVRRMGDGTFKATTCQTAPTVDVEYHVQLFDGQNLIWRRNREIIIPSTNIDYSAFGEAIELFTLGCWRQASGNITNFTKGYIGEFGAYNRVISANELELLENYLFTRYPSSRLPLETIEWPWKGSWNYFNQPSGVYSDA